MRLVSGVLFNEGHHSRGSVFGNTVGFVRYIKGLEDFDERYWITQVKELQFYIALKILTT